MSNETRRAGILLHPTSLPGSNGIGELGREALEFVNWLAAGGQSLWQVMPLGPTGYGDSPYQCFSAFAANPLLISLDRLIGEGLLAAGDLQPLRELPADHVDYGAVIPLKFELLGRAYHAFLREADDSARGEFNRFKQRFHGWINDYALFMALKDVHDGQSWNQWPQELRDRHDDAVARVVDELFDRIEFHRWLQFKTFTQWWEVRHHAKTVGIQVLGDLPIFVAFDSADVWANRELFHLDQQGNPTVVAGVPPDYFSETGQRWGNPLYNWDVHINRGFRWWEARLRAAFELVDIVRIDHFRGFDACWQIPAHEETAVNGAWIPAPGHALFGSLRERMGEISVVAENLGVITPQVEDLRKRFGFPGMRVLQFAWDSGPGNAFLPHNHTPDSVVYTGTHDNNTTRGWFEQEATSTALAYLKEYLGHDPVDTGQELIRMAYASTASMSVVPLQDWLGLGSEARMNLPGRASGNWGWRVRSEQLNGELCGRMRILARTFNRIPVTKENEPAS